MSVTLLYHFTSMKNWRRIRADGTLRLVNGYANMRQIHGVVWLTTSEDPAGQGLDPTWHARQLAEIDDNDKRRIRITVDIPRSWAPRYTEWHPKHSGDPQLLARMRAQFKVGTWRVCERVIDRHHWTAVTDLHTGTHLSMVNPAGLGFRKLYATTGR